MTNHSKKKIKILLEYTKGNRKFVKTKIMTVGHNKFVEDL